MPEAIRVSTPGCGNASGQSGALGLIAAEHERGQEADLVIERQARTVPALVSPRKVIWGEFADGFDFEGLIL